MSRCTHAIMRAVKNSDQRAENTDQRDQHAKALIILMGTDQPDGNHEPENAIGTELGHHPGEQHRTGRWRFDISDRQPGMQRKDRGLHHERAEEPECYPELLACGKMVLGVDDHLAHFESAGLCAKVHDRSKGED